MVFLRNSILLILLVLNCKESDFYETHWNPNLGFQGSPPAHFTELEKNLNPSACKTCHKEQWEKWQFSFHAKSYSSGLLWQKEILNESERKNCLRCHSPLPETKALSCASCHVRNYIHYGPPPKEVTNETKTTNLPHDGFVVQNEFEDSKFCKNCHESPDTGAQINSKKQMETYTEWKNSKFAKQEIHCQNCHMPGRTHEWKGIHDKDMVLKGLDIQFLVERVGSQDKLICKIASKNIGHYFPTYLVPKIYVKFYRNNKNQQTLIDIFTIGRIVNLNLTEEYEDTRIKPGETRIYSVLSDSINIKNLEYILKIDVDPGEQYIRLFEEQKKHLKNTLSKESLFLINESLREKRNSRYNLITWKRLAPVSLPE
ncbi:multiheme c-type cytochrome [Leptospira sp. 96542]|nr:multiheme c-type cytochrome [Leptospira sp. 96542]